MQQTDKKQMTFSDIFQTVWLKRRFILIFTAVFLAIGFFVSIFSPVKYTSDCIVVPQAGKDQPGGNLGGIAAMMGVNLNGASMAERPLTPETYPAIMKSIPFTKELMQTKITVKKSEGKPITLYEYYTNDSYSVGFFRRIIGTIKPNKAPVELFVDTLYQNRSLNSQDEKNAYDAIHGAIVFTTNETEKNIKISYTFPEAEAAAVITENLTKLLQKYVGEFKTDKAKENLAFVEKSYQEARKDFIQKQASLAAYQDGSFGLVSARGKAVEKRLESDYDIAFSVYSELAKQREKAQLAAQETQTILTVISPANVPIEKSEPRRGRILAMWLIFGLILSCTWIFVKPFLKNIVKKESE